MISISALTIVLLACGFLSVGVLYYLQRRGIAPYLHISDLDGEAKEIEASNAKACEEAEARRLRIIAEHAELVEKHRDSWTAILAEHEKTIGSYREAEVAFLARDNEQRSALNEEAEAHRLRTIAEHAELVEKLRDSWIAILAEHEKTIGRYREAEVAFLARDNEQRSALNAEYRSALLVYEELKKEIAIGQDSLETMSFGIYQPHFTFQTPEEYKAKIETLRNQQTQVVRENRAWVCPVKWSVGESIVEGRKMVRLQSKLMLRAFNGECEAAIANVSWSNATTMEERVRKAFTAINKLGAVQQITMTDLYLTLKVEELNMAREYEQKRHEEREAQRRVREQIREEEKAQKEIDDALAESTADEDKFGAAIAKARDEATQAMGAKLEALTEQISKFEAKLDEARKKKERAIARAQLTKSGFVYIISNIGSFGERVFKIGMTRRLEPMERIYELSGASVPFPYDLHAMLFCDDAPALEHELHNLFKDRRMNRVNMRREFFHGVGLEEIESFVKTKGLSAQFMQLPEAREYRQTMSLREAIQAEVSVTGNFPDTLFPGA